MLTKISKKPYVYLIITLAVSFIMVYEITFIDNYYNGTGANDPTFKYMPIYNAITPSGFLDEFLWYRIGIPIGLTLDMSLGMIIIDKNKKNLLSKQQFKEKVNSNHSEFTD